MRILFYIAAVGWFLGLAIHLTALLGINIEAQVPFIWVLHFGIFIVFAPPVIKMSRSEEMRELKKSQSINPLDGLKVFRTLFRGSPSWLVMVALAGFIYAIINFALFMSTSDGYPKIMDGQYALTDHGKFIRHITESEYHLAKANQTRGFSGHWIAFYGISIAMLYQFSGLGKTNN